MVSFLKFYSSSFTIALVLWPFVSVVLTLPILAVIYRRYHRLRFSAVLASYLSVLYLLGLVAFTLYPMPDDPVAYCAAHHIRPQLQVMQFVQDLQTHGLSALLQLGFNVLLFIPFGFIMTRWLRWKPWIVLPAGLLTSLLIETSQLTGFWHLYPCAYRYFDVDDLLTNTLGTLIGVMIAVIFNLISPPKETDHAVIVQRPKLLHRAVSYALDMFLVVFTYFPIGLGGVYVFHKKALPQPDGSYLFHGFTVTTSLLDHGVQILAFLAFLLYELLIPATHRGQTLAGMFTHMTVETKPRQGALRAAFYMARTLVLYLPLCWLVSDRGQNLPIYALVLLIFYMVARQMPYDLIPGSHPYQSNQFDQFDQETSAPRFAASTQDYRPSAPLL
ncbi:hypothetical protein CRD60_03935 [Bifidobacterium aemilianum]|uniref:VanZ-like domain-containing protein n=1 Tax=Bifidobacterium aemilianum TaxID=2493120 RepID=A0A366K7X4_9BIFI|nr:VanZ family protein [Bifidobacterium aemilianum]RBP97764.1 hypothetical protein CRD60_03935 [Bifidobacterium aemilianum]